MASIEEIFVPAEQQPSTSIKMEPNDYFDGRETVESNHVENTLGCREGQIMGEIMRISNKDWRFVCVYCTHEFNIFAQFTAHIEDHLNKLLEASFDIKPVVVEMEMLDEFSLVNQNLMKELQPQQPYNVKTTPAKETKNKYYEPKVLLSECPKCGRRFIDDVRMLHHLNVNCVGPTMPCKFCKHKIPIDDIAHHLKAVHQTDEHRFICDLCGKKFDHKARLKVHLTNHKMKKPGMFDILGEILPFEMKFDETIASKCTLCQKVLSNQYNMMRHVKDVHLNKHKGKRGRTKKPYAPKDECIMTCDYCQKTFRNRGNLQTHMILHTPIEDRIKYACHVCGLTFDRNSTFRRHVFNHDPENMVECKVCKKSFQKIHLLDHMRSHANQRLYECKICQKAFNVKRQLYRHSVVHSTERMYQCDLCPKNYLRPYELKVHKRTHTGNYIYNCTECQNGYVRKKSLKKHMVSIHKRSLDGNMKIHWRD